MQGGTTSLQPDLIDVMHAGVDTQDFIELAGSLGSSSTDGHDIIMLDQG